MFVIRPVESWKDLFGQIALWQRLHHQLTPENLFTSPFWSRIWFESHGVRRKRKILLLTSTAQDAEGVILLSIEKTKRIKFPVISVETIGLGRSANRRHYVFEQEPLIEKSAIDSLLACISKMKRWTFFRLAPLPHSYPLSEDIVEAAPRYGMTALRRTYGIGYKIKVQNGWDTYEKSRPKKFRQNINRAYRRLQSAGEFNIVAHGKGDSPKQMVRIIETVSKNSWKVRDGNDILNSSFKGFFENILFESLPEGYTTIWVLYHCGHPIAYEWHMLKGRRLIALKADFDQQYAHFSPGNILAWHALKAGFESYVSEIDYLFGGGDYKRKWANDRYQMEELLLFNSSLYSRLIHKILIRQDWIERLWRLSNRINFTKKPKA